MEIKICIGSACHLKGSYQVVSRLKELVIINDLEKHVELKSDFCLGQCGDGVSIMIEDDPVYSVKLENLDNFFNEKVMQEVR